jgi:hypothetical protein
LTHLYRLENFLHFSHLHKSVSWQLGQWNFAALSAGLMGLLHELQSGRVTVDCDISLETPSGTGSYRLLRFTGVGPSQKGPCLC